MADTPDLPDPSAPPSVADLILAAGSFIIAFPAYLFAQVGEPLDVTEKILVYGGVIFDGLFWAIATVSLYQCLRWHFRKERFRN